MALDATVGGSSANSYCTETEADDYHEQHVAGASWESPTGAQEELKEAALIQATRMLDAHMDWDGVVASQTQALMWPRIGVIGRNGYEIASSVIPTEVTQATAELARQLLAADLSADSDVQREGIASLKAGSVELTFRPDVTGKPIPDAVFYLIRHLGTLRMPGVGTVPLVRV